MEKNISIWKLILKCVLAVLIVFSILASLVILPMWIMWSIDDWKREQQLPQVRELAETYLAEKYPGNDFEITNLYHHWYDSVFYVKVCSQTSADTYFTLTYDDDPPEFRADSYKRDVLEGGNVFDRVTEEYNAAVLTALGEDFPQLEVEADFVGAQYKPGNVDIPEAKLDITWELDKQYDLSVLGAQAGVVTVRFDNTKGQWPQEARMDVLRQIAQTLLEANLDFFAVDVKLAEELYDESPLYHFAERIVKCELD